MTRKPTPAAYLVLAAVSAMSLFGLACLGEGPVLQPSEANGDEEIAEQCDNVLGKAFASPEQRQWFIDNCSSWPLRDVPEAAAAVEALPNDSPECAQMRGKPYESQEQRTWFLANCVHGPAGVQQTISGSDRTNCAEIQGTRYRSAAERQWFLANCLTQVVQQDDDDDDDDDDRGRGRNGNRRNR